MRHATIRKENNTWIVRLNGHRYAATTSHTRAIQYADLVVTQPARNRIHTTLTRARNAYDRMNERRD